MSDNHGLPTGKHTLVEEGTEFKGTMSSNCPIVVMGKVEGEVAGPVIHVTKSGVVAGTVKVKELHSAGEVAGEVQAEAVRLSGRVRDKTVIRTKSLEVVLTSEGGMQVVFGECELAVGDEPNKDAAIAAAQGAKPADAPHATDKRRRGPSEMWEEPTTTSKTEPEEAEPGGKRRRGTMPPPMT